MEDDRDLDWTGGDGLDQVRRQVHIAVPGIGRPRAPVHRQSMVARIGQRHRLDQDARILGGTEEGALEGQDAAAIACGALGEKYQDVTCPEAIPHLVAGIAGGMTAVAVDEDGALQPCQAAEEGPAAHLALGDEGQRCDCAEHQDIDPAYMIAGDQHRPLAGRLTDDAQPDAEEAADHTVVVHGKPARHAGPEPDEELLQRHQRAG